MAFAPRLPFFLVGDVHRPALAATIAFRLAKEFAKHLFEFCALGHAVTVATVS